MMSAKKSVFRIYFTSQGKGYEIYARKVNQSDIYGFVEIEEIVFGERSAIVVDPSEEALKNEFSAVKRLMVPYHSISRIDEVEKEGQAKVIALAASNAEEKPPPGPPFKRND